MKKYVVGILVSKDYSNFMKIKTVIYDTAEKLGRCDIEMCQITDNYMHDETKKFIQELDIFYTDVLRYDENFTIFSHDPNKHKFNKPFNGKFFHIRNGAFVSHCDGIFCFVPENLEEKDAIYQILIKAKAKNKKLKIFN